MRMSALRSTAVTKKDLVCALLVVSAFAMNSSLALAQSSNDMWTALAKNTGAFDPHPNFCSATEVFIPVGAGNLGYCIEKNERAAAVWVTAKQDCAKDGKRLPEPAEWQQACKTNPGGLLTNMTNNWEFATNTPIGLQYTNGIADLEIVVMGLGGCTFHNLSVAARNAGGVEESHEYRCVR